MKCRIIHEDRRKNIMKPLLLIAIAVPLASISAQELTEPRIPRGKQAPLESGVRAAGVYQLTGEDEWNIKWIGTLVVRTENAGEIAGYIDWIGSGGQCGPLPVQNLQ